MWKIVVEPDWPQMIMWLMPFSCWIPKAINALSEYVLVIDFHCNSGCTNVPQCDVTRTLPALLKSGRGLK